MNETMTETTKPENISSLQKDLTGCSIAKRDVANKMAAVQKQLDDIFEQLKKNVDEKRTLAKSINEIKEKELDPVNKDIEDIKKKLVIEPAEKPKQTATTSKDGKYISPRRIEDEIKRLEFSIETEPMSFTKEKSLMDKIRGLKNLFVKVKQEQQISHELNKRYSDLREKFLMRRATIFKIKNIKDKLNELDKKGEDGKKKIAELKHARAGLKDEMNKIYERAREINTKLQEKLIEVAKAPRKDFSRKPGFEKPRHEEKKSLYSKEQANERIKQIEQKIMNKEKLTTEDLLMYQELSQNR